MVVSAIAIFTQTLPFGSIHIINCAMFANHCIEANHFQQLILADVFRVSVVVLDEEILLFVLSFCLNLCNATPVNVTLKHLCTSFYCRRVCKHLGNTGPDNIDKISPIDVMCHHARCHAKMGKSIVILLNRMDCTPCAIVHICVILLLPIPASSSGAIIPGETQQTVFSADILFYRIELNSWGDGRILTVSINQISNKLRIDSRQNDVSFLIVKII
mmetsp:Transcript_20437/g.58641  ORF Transcript_20437/g.58641 Transcript_20437/m.58641 type:complete len:216 (+) Transcript_20437:116-763(+)